MAQVTITLDAHVAAALLAALTASNAPQNGNHAVNGNGGGNGRARAIANPAGPQASQEQVTEWHNRYGQVFLWIWDHYGKNGFATDLFEKSLVGYGQLTAPQFNKVAEIVGIADRM
jgi:hypothetical protein